MVMGDDGMEEGQGGTLLGLPELDTEVDVRQMYPMTPLPPCYPFSLPPSLLHRIYITQYNTAHNRQISMVGIFKNEKVRKRKNRPHSVSFSDSEEIINPGERLVW